MNIDIMRAFFGWCTIINGGLLVVAFAFCSLAGNFIYRIHSKLYPIGREAFNLAIYSFLGIMKILVLTLNLVPYIALVVLTSR